jgi:putative SOS response-associated peptidase YedK
MAPLYAKLCAVCGRFTLTVPGFDELCDALGLRPEPASAALYQPRYNIAPSNLTWVLTTSSSAESTQLSRSRWGYQGAGSAQRAKPLRNARAELLRKAVPFELALGQRRCVVVADGFLEWDAKDDDRRPYWLRPSDHGLMLMAGVYAENEATSSFAIVTCAANADVQDLHARMPRLLDQREAVEWLEPGWARLLDPPPAGRLRKTRVSQRVNAVRNDDPACLLPDEGPIAGSNLELFASLARSNS